MAALKISPSHADTQTSLKLSESSQAGSPAMSTSKEHYLHGELKNIPQTFLSPTNTPLAWESSVVVLYGA